MGRPLVSVGLHRRAAFLDSRLEASPEADHQDLRVEEGRQEDHLDSHLHLALLEARRRVSNHLRVSSLLVVDEAFLPRDFQAGELYTKNSWWSRELQSADPALSGSRRCLPTQKGGQCQAFGGFQT